MGLKDRPIRSDHVRDPRGDPGGRRVAGAVGQPDFAFRVAEKRERVVELLGKGRVVLDRIERDAEDLRVLLPVIGVEVAEPATLGRSAGSVRLRIEPEHDSLSPVIGKPLCSARVVRNRELGRLVTGVQHLSPPQSQDQLEDILECHDSQVSFESSKAGRGIGQPFFSNRSNSQTRAHFKNTP